MKKTTQWLSTLLALTLALSLTACGSTATSSAAGNSTASSATATQSAAPSSEVQSAPAESVPEAASNAASETTGATANGTGSKILIAYFTRAENIAVDPNVDAIASASINVNGDAVTGNVQILAGMIATVTDGDVFSIQTEEKYPTGYRDTTDLASTEQSEAARPALATHVENFEDYDVIFLGYPNWWGTLPMAVETFLEEYDFTGKTIIPFASHEGSGLGSGPRDIEPLCPDATVLDGLAVRGGSVSGAQSDVESWISNLNLDDLIAE